LEESLDYFGPDYRRGAPGEPNNKQQGTHDVEGQRIKRLRIWAKTKPAEDKGNERTRKVREQSAPKGQQRADRTNATLGIAFPLKDPSQQRPHESQVEQGTQGHLGDTPEMEAKKDRGKDPRRESASNEGQTQSDGQLFGQGSNQDRPHKGHEEPAPQGICDDKGQEHEEEAKHKMSESSSSRNEEEHNEGKQVQLEGTLPQDQERLQKGHSDKVTQQQLDFGEGQKCDEQGQGEGQESARQRLRRLQNNLKEKKAAMAKAKATAKEENWISIQSLNLQGPPLHGSHRLHHRRGIVWCWGCGKYATEYVKPGLAAPCAPQDVTRGANNFLNRLRDGLTPRQDLRWPYDIGHGPPEGRVRV